MRRARHILAGGAALLFAGCYAEANANLHKTLRTRAAFDLQCSEDSLKISELDSDGRVVTVAGVEGCNHRATYVYDHYWLLNALDGRPVNVNDHAQKEANQ